MIVMSSIIQFHHHSGNGNLEFPTATISLHNVDEDIIDHCHNHTNKNQSTHCCCNHQNNESNNNCSAHIGEYHISKLKSIFSKTFPILLFDVLISESTINATSNLSYSSSNIFSKDIPINSIIQDVESLRAPPIFY